jgi:hypothetical protein
MNILFKCSTTVLFVFRKLYKKSSGKNIFLIIKILSSQHVKTQLQSLVLTNILQLLLQRYIINLLSFIKPEVIKLLVWGSLLFGLVFVFDFDFVFVFCLFVCFLFCFVFFVLFFYEYTTKSYKNQNVATRTFDFVQILFWSTQQVLRLMGETQTQLKMSFIMK